MCYVACRHRPVGTECNSFLGNNPVSFCQEKYRLSQTASGLNSDSEDIKALKALLVGNKKLSVIDICKKLSGKNKDCDIALGDLVFYSRLLRADRNFEKAGAVAKKDAQFGTLKLLDKDIYAKDAYYLPANFGNMKWEFVGSRKNLPGCSDKSAKKKLSARQMMIATVAGLQRGTATSVAEELLRRYAGQAVPSAYFVAKVFMHLDKLGGMLKWEKG